MASDQDKNRQRVKQLLGKPGNGNCADCGAAGPEWASYTLGVFVCHSCSGLHRNIAQISKVKSLLLDPWSSSELEFMDSMGNSAAKAKYEQIVPAFYYCPTYKDCMLQRGVPMETRQRQRTIPQPKIYSIRAGGCPEVLQQARCQRAQSDNEDQYCECHFPAK